MTRNAWAFAVDADHWLPLPRLSQLNDVSREQWLRAAQGRIYRANLASESDLGALDLQCAALLEAVTEGEQCVYFPIMEPFPVVVDIDTRTSQEITALRQAWQREDAPGTRAVETTPADHAHLADAVRVMRVDELDDGSIRYSVGFFGLAPTLGVALTAATDQPLVAGQLAGAGLHVFQTFQLRDQTARVG